MNSQTLLGFALDASADIKYKAFSPEAWAKAAEVAIVGMLMIFAVLSVLWGVLAIFKTVFAKDAPKANTAKAEAPAAVPEAAEATAAPVPAASDDGELIAVISAAIAAYRATEEGLDGDAASGFRVVSFKRAAKGRPWNSNK